jgi:hypothetical protein
MSQWCDSSWFNHPYNVWWRSLIWSFLRYSCCIRVNTAVMLLLRNPVNLEERLCSCRSRVLIFMTEVFCRDWIFLKGRHKIIWKITASETHIKCFAYLIIT